VVYCILEYFGGFEPVLADQLLVPFDTKGRIAYKDVFV